MAKSVGTVCLVAAALFSGCCSAQTFPIWGDGLQTRNFTYVGDTVMGIALAGAMLDGFSVINIGTDSHHTILDLVREICLSMNWEPSEIQKQLDKPVGVKSRAADVTQCRERLGWVPCYSLREGIQRTASWYLRSFRAQDKEVLERLLMERS
jgi:nucleoside-diphosphate-sugar epimerase